MNANIDSGPLKIWPKLFLVCHAPGEVDPFLFFAPLAGLPGGGCQHLT
jgi:hypothetical protein